MRSQNFGIEIEMTGLTRAAAARIIAGHFDTQATHVGGGYDDYTIRDNRNRQWKVVSDASIRCRNGNNRSASRDYSVEFVSPICQYEDIETVQELVRKLRAGGAKVNDSCGIHVHVDAANHNRQSLKNLLSIMFSKEDILFKALDVNPNRVEAYCKKVREPMLRKARQLSAEETTDLTQLESIWYEGNIESGKHYSWTRYYALNLHAVFYRGTVEFRCFNSTLHADRAAAYINLCLAMSAQAINQRSAIMQKTHSDNELFTFRVWLVRLGLNGPEFKNTRDILLTNLDGDRAWRYDKDSYEVNKRKRQHREMER